MFVHVQRMPVIHPCAAEIPVRDPETERMNEVKPRPGERTHAADVAGILGNFGTKEHDVQHTRSVEKHPIGSIQTRSSPRRAYAERLRTPVPWQLAL